ncbi:MAG: MFS transporter [Candidatus Azosocius agrarius]|nr:MAG: MFS transporter [Gammaproteobacteria bacterium]
MIFVYLKNKLCNNFVYILFIVFFFGIMSGLPFLLILSTLNMWLLEIGLNKTQMGLFALSTIPYSIKFFFGPYIDYVKIPLLSAFFGQRKSWLLLSQFLLIISIITLALSDPYNNFFYSILCAFLVGLFSAIQDVVIEVYRIELLKIYNIELGLGSTIFVLGYRTGMLISGSGALYFSFYYNSWIITYFIMAGFIFFGILITLISNDPVKNYNNSSNILYTFKFLFSYFIKLQDIKIIMLFIIFFKIGDTLLNAMSMSFLIELGFSKLEIIYIVKTFGICLMILGGVIGGFFLIKKKIWYLLLICCILQIFTSFLFLLQSIIGYNVVFLFYVVAIENFASGMSQVALVTYFSYLCCKEYTTIYYAFLSSFSSFVRINLSFFGGIFADFVIWDVFYLIICFICFPSVLILFMFKRHFFNLLKN